MSSGADQSAFIQCRNCVALPLCTILHRNCNVTALRCRTKVIHLNLKCGDLQQKVIDISTPQCNVSMNGPLDPFIKCQLI